MKKKTIAVLAVFLGAFAVSFASIFIRYITAAPIIIAFYRMFITVILLTPFYVIREKKKETVQKYGKYYLLSGVFLALHFYMWIASLSYTTVSSSVILVSTHPIFVVIYSHFVIKEKASSLTIAGVLMAIAGTVVISTGDMGQGTNMLLGNILALGGAAMMAGYLLVGRKLRQVISTLNYTFWVYGIATLVLLGLSLLLKAPIYPYSLNTYFIFFLLALIPTLMGHSVFNWALDKIPVSLVSVMFLGEPVGATLLAWLILKEPPGLPQYVGGFFILTGLYLTTRTAIKGKHVGLKATS